MSLVEKYGLLPEEIDRKSLQMVEAGLPLDSPLSPWERSVVSRIVRAEGDPAIAKAVGFSPNAVAKGVAALQAGSDIVTDVRMVQVGISQQLLQQSNTAVHCSIAAPEVADRAQREGTTRSVAAMRELAPYLDGSIVAIGNAPTALLALLDLADDGRAKPALVIGMPVGFVACAESKRELAERQLPYITVWEHRGGSSTAAATVNALLALSLGAETL
jgi:precorrin-8X/cobalt-precorrin-8 methylmutase